MVAHLLMQTGGAAYRNIKGIVRTITRKIIRTKPSRSLENEMKQAAIDLRLVRAVKYTAEFTPCRSAVSFTCGLAEVQSTMDYITIHLDEISQTSSTYCEYFLLRNRNTLQIFKSAAFQLCCGFVTDFSLRI